MVPGRRGSEENKHEIYTHGFKQTKKLIFMKLMRNICSHLNTTDTIKKEILKDPPTCRSKTSKPPKKASTWKTEFVATLICIS